MMYSVDLRRDLFKIEYPTLARPAMTSDSDAGRQ
jgi:hypothetical protein